MSPVNRHSPLSEAWRVRIARGCDMRIFRWKNCEYRFDDNGKGIGFFIDGIEKADTTSKVKTWSLFENNVDMIKNLASAGFIEVL